MMEWLFNKKGVASVILDSDMVRNKQGYVIGWIKGPHVYSSHGEHIGWLEGGVLYDIYNCPLLFSRNRTNYLPTNPGITGPPGMVGFASPPGKPGFQGARGMPGRSERWSAYDPLDYFE